MLENTSWCNRFIEAWLLAYPGGDATFARRLAQRSFAYQGERVSPKVAAREHLDLMRRIQAATAPPGSR
jgi:hypothetical protein